MVSLMQNEGKTDNRKTMITFSSDDFSAPSESRTSELQTVACGPNVAHFSTNYNT